MLTTQPKRPILHRHCPDSLPHKEDYTGFFHALGMQLEYKSLVPENSTCYFQVPGKIFSESCLIDPRQLLFETAALKQKVVDIFAKQGVSAGVTIDCNSNKRNSDNIFPSEEMYTALRSRAYPQKIIVWFPNLVNATKISRQAADTIKEELKALSNI